MAWLHTPPIPRSAALTVRIVFDRYAVLVVLPLQITRFPRKAA